jgi:hypothetical protein
LTNEKANRILDDFSVMLFSSVKIVIEMKNEVERKLKIENLTRCMNCTRFVTCSEDKKENVVDCQHYQEIGVENQVVVESLKECCGLADRYSKVIYEVFDELRDLTDILSQELVPLNDRQLAKQLAKCAENLSKLVRLKAGVAK